MLAPLLRRALGCLKMRDRSYFSGGSGIAVNYDNAKGRLSVGSRILHRVFFRCLDPVPSQVQAQSPETRSPVAIPPKFCSSFPALRIAQTLQGLTSGHDRNAFDLSECEHVFLVAGNDHVGFPGDCRS